jgi:transposase
MEVLYPRCAGLDVHKATVVACVRRLETSGQVTRAVRTFGTQTRDLHAMRDWLGAHGCTHAALESTGVYWKPVWHVLEGHVALVLANAQHVRQVPGRKSDVNDATWLADLLAHGLLRASFVPPAAVQRWRDLSRTRKQLVRELSRHSLRIQKLLEDANVKLTGQLSELLGASGRAILQALAAGETDPERLAALVNPRVRAPRAALVEALRGDFTAHHRFLLQVHLTQIEALERAVRDLEARLGAGPAPFRTAAARLATIPGVSTTVAHALLAEIGLDMRHFPGAAHLVSWAGLCPRLDESAGHRRSVRTRPSAPWLKTLLVQAAWAATRNRQSYLHAQFLRLKARRGPKRAIVAVAASILTAAYHMLRDGTDYHDLGAAHFARRDPLHLQRQLIARLRRLGLDVEVRPAA